jgi:hypothetical protein
MFSETDKLLLYITTLIFSIPIGNKTPEQRLLAEEKLFFQLLAPEQDMPVTELDTSNETYLVPSWDPEQWELREEAYDYVGVFSSLGVFIICLLLDILIRYLFQRYWNKGKSEEKLRQVIQEHFFAEFKKEMDSLKEMNERIGKLETQLYLTLKEMCGGVVKVGAHKTVLHKAGDGGVKKLVSSRVPKRKPS